jgi:hypothetical protein
VDGSKPRALPWAVMWLPLRGVGKKERATSKSASEDLPTAAPAAKPRRGVGASDSKTHPGRSSRAPKSCKVI